MIVPKIFVVDKMIASLIVSWQYNQCSWKSDAKFLERHTDLCNREGILGQIMALEILKL